MQIIVLAGERKKEEIITNGLNATIIWIESVQQFLQYKDADAFVDLEFVNNESRKNLLAQLLPKPVIVNAVIDTISEIHPAFIRINGWNTFLSSPYVEASCLDEAKKSAAEKVFAVFNKNVAWLPDDPGFVTARIVSMIINEAFLSLAEGVSTKDEINTAMKLGTAYPFGPFEWAEKIELHNVVALLEKLSGKFPRYKPSELMVQETKIPV